MKSRRARGPAAKGTVLLAHSGRCEAAGIAVEEISIS